MPSILHIASLATLLVLARPVQSVQLNTLTYVGCFSTEDPMTAASEATYTWQSSGHCQEICVDDSDAPVIGLSDGNECFCGTNYPSNSTLVDDSNCDVPCTGFGQDMCGGDGYYTVFLTNSGVALSGSGGGSSSSSSSTTSGSSTSTVGSTTTSAGPSVVTSVTPGKTVVVTQSASAESSTTADSSSSGGSSTHTGAIIGGVVAGIAAICAAVGGTLFYMRYRRKKHGEEEWKRQQAVQSMSVGGMGARPFIPAARKPSGPDSRIDAEAMAHRRLSDGSIADNEDYSRRILQVTNPDGGHR